MSFVLHVFICFLKMKIFRGGLKGTPTRIFIKSSGVPLQGGGLY